MIEIVVPVFNAADATRQCLAALARHTDVTVPVTVIDDASTDPEISTIVERFTAERKNTRLVVHETNQGFVRSVNEAMADCEHDVILLNSDAIVTPDWLVGFERCAASDARIATITPFSNNAEICSWPRFCENNPVPDSPDQLAGMIRAFGSNRYPDLPTAVGFCMYIRRSAREELGLFDASTFGLGYGEENDFCRRADAAGWRNVLCDDTYVVHLGGRSFEATGHRPGGENLQRLLDRYPDYNRIIADFIREDPIAPIRSALNDFIRSTMNEESAAGNNPENDDMTDKNLPFTGERFTPECVREIWYEHMHRYVAIRQLIAGKRVLDMACGEGYGSHMMSRHAAQVTGMDISDEAISHARDRYASTENLSFAQGSVTAIDAADDSFDVIVSFETIEHLHEQEQMLSEFDRVLTADGMLIISSPDKATYSDAVGHDNEFHVRELYRDEFESLLDRHFPARLMYAQKLMFQSVIYALEREQAGGRSADWVILDGDTVTDDSAVKPLYYIAIAARSKQQLPDFDRLHLFQDLDESVYRHYYHEIRKNMQSGEMLIEQQQQVDQLQSRLAKLDRLPGWLQRLLGLSDN